MPSPRTCPRTWSVASNNPPSESPLSVQHALRSRPPIGLTAIASNTLLPHLQHQKVISKPIAKVKLKRCRRQARHIHTSRSLVLCLARCRASANPFPSHHKSCAFSALLRTLGAPRQQPKSQKPYFSECGLTETSSCEAWFAQVTALGGRNIQPRAVLHAVPFPDTVAAAWQ